MQIDILTLFPAMFAGPFDYSIIKLARQKAGVKIVVHDLRHWASGSYRSVDDHPYGGGPGMVLRVDVIDRALTDLKNSRTQKLQNSKVILLDAAGERYSQQTALQLTKQPGLILICGHYEGVDHRVHERLADRVISIGDYVLSGGEIPAMVMVDSIVRLLPKVLGNPESLSEESYSEESSNLEPSTYPLAPRIEYPQYTRPEDYKGWKVPEVLLSGNHRRIRQWRQAGQRSPV